MSMEEKQNSQTFQGFNQSVLRPSTREEISEIVKSYPEINWGIVGLPPLRIALYTCVAVTALGGILSNPLFKLANTAVSETPFLQDIIATANNIS